jgi:cysteine desulfurase
MGLDTERSLAALRLSLGRWSSPSDIDRAADLIIAAARRPGRATSPAAR